MQKRRSALSLQGDESSRGDNIRSQRRFRCDVAAALEARGDSASRLSAEPAPSVAERHPATEALVLRLRNAALSLQGDESSRGDNIRSQRRLRSDAAALRLDPNLAQAYPAQGFLHFTEQSWAEADAAFRRALELSPTYATAHHWYGVYRGSIGDWEEYRRQMEEARRLDPGSPIIATDVGISLSSLGRTAEARVVCREVLEAFPGFWRAMEGLGTADFVDGRYADAARAFEKAYEVCGEIAWTDGVIAMAHGKAGNLDRARQELQRLEQRAAVGYVSPIGFALAHHGLGDMDRCFEWLDRAVIERDPRFLVLFGATYSDIHADPRWAALEQRMNYPSWR